MSAPLWQPGEARIAQANLTAFMAQVNQDWGVTCRDYGTLYPRDVLAHAIDYAGNGYPLVHKIYEPLHHGDFAFQAATKNGVRAHHWRFGDMQPVPGVTDKQVEWIVKYVREMQRANGIQ